jgi:hypothetical protein
VTPSGDTVQTPREAFNQAPTPALGQAASPALASGPVTPAAALGEDSDIDYDGPKTTASAAPRAAEQKDTPAADGVDNGDAQGFFAAPIPNTPSGIGETADGLAVVARSDQSELAPEEGLADVGMEWEKSGWKDEQGEQEQSDEPDINYSLDPENRDVVLSLDKEWPSKDFHTEMWKVNSPNAAHAKLLVQKIRARTNSVKELTKRGEFPDRPTAKFMTEIMSARKLADQRNLILGLVWIEALVLELPEVPPDINHGFRLLLKEESQLLERFANASQILFSSNGPKAS